MAEDLNIDKTDDVNGILLKNRKDVASGRSGRESRNDFSKATQVVIKRNPYKEKDITKIGTWNVRTMLQHGKAENVVREMIRGSINILGLWETRYAKEKDFVCEGYRFICSGAEKQGLYGVGIVLDQDHAKKVIQIDDINERIMMIKLDTVPVKTTIIQVYMPTSNSKDEEVITLYEIAEEIMGNSGNDNIIMMGDYNAIVGEENADSYIGKYGLGKKNDRGSMLREFANNNKMVICNTVFKQPKRRIWTWQSPRSERYQLDYIMIRSRYRNIYSKKLP